MSKKSIKEQLLKKAERETDFFPWGKLEWFARRTLNGADMTLGFCYINPRMENAMHIHPNCDEVLGVVEGTIIHRLDGEEVEMHEGDSLFVPQGAMHNAHNPTDKVVVLSIAFPTGDRQTQSV